MEHKLHLTLAAHKDRPFPIFISHVAHLVQRGALVESKNIFGDSFLAKALYRGDRNLIEAVLDCAFEVLDHHQV